MSELPRTSCSEKPYMDAKLAEGMSEAEMSYTRRMNAANIQGKSLEEVEEARTKKSTEDVEKRLQVSKSAQRSVTVPVRSCPEQLTSCRSYSRVALRCRLHSLCRKPVQQWQSIGASWTWHDKRLPKYVEGARTMRH